MEELQNKLQVEKKAVEFYRKYKKDEEMLKLIQSKEFVYVLSKLSSLINLKTNKMLIKTYKSIEEKNKIMEDSPTMNQYRFIALSDRVEIIEINNDDKVEAYALLSYENEIDFGQYAFLHFIYFTNNKHKKNYKNFEKLIMQKLKSMSILYFDRTISFQPNNNEDKTALEEIKNMGYMCIWKNCKIELNIEKCITSPIKVKMEKSNDIEVDYTSIGKIIPTRFENRSEIYKGSLEDGEFFINMINNNEKAFINFYIYNGKIGDQNYIRQVYEVTFNFLAKHNINKLVTFASPENIIILKNIVNISVLQNIYWLRKQL